VRDDSIDLRHMWSMTTNKRAAVIEAGGTVLAAASALSADATSLAPTTPLISLPDGDQPVAPVPAAYTDSMPSADLNYFLA
jgi:hypothetical protein